MPEYHRGKARSPYRKRSATFAQAHGSAGVKVNAVLISPVAGLVESKSWRGALQISGDTGGVATGWAGFYRGEDSTQLLQAKPAAQLLAQSEVFGVVPWTRGTNDHLYELSLVGITLSVQENLYVVTACTGFTSGTVDLAVALLYAEKEIPA